MAILSIMLMLPGSPVPDWLVFLAPIVLFVIIIKTGKWFKQWIRGYVIPRFFNKKLQIDDSAEDDVKPFEFS